MQSRNGKDLGGLWGVCGWFGDIKSAEPPEAILARMADPDWQRDASALTHATQRAAICISPATPGADLTAENHLVVAIYGYPAWSDSALAALGKQKGHAAAAVEGYRRHGWRIVDVLHGAFGLVILDADHNRAFIAIDRMGIYPLYYCDNVRDGVIFASSATALARHPRVGTSIHPQALFSYLFFYRVPAPYSIFSSQRKLLPAQYVSSREGRVETGFYWRVSFANPAEADRRELEQTLFERLRDAVRRVVADEDLERIGAFLSGGLDSSTVVGLLSELSPNPCKAFTIGFDFEGYDESDFAQAAASHFRARHYIYKVTESDVVEFAPRLAESYDEPFGNASAVAVYYCALLAQHHGVDLLIAGDGGDELFAGNKIYLQMKYFELYKVIPQWVRRGLIEPVLDGIPGGEWFWLLRKARRYASQARIPMPDRMLLAELERFSGADDVLNPAVAATVDPQHVLMIARERYEQPSTAAFEQRMHHLDWQIVLADNDLRKVNRMCELAGVRVRFPMLDDEVVAFSAQVPPAWFLQRLRLRAFYKQALRNFLPQTTLKKQKKGFGLPYGPLLRTGGRLQTLAYEALTSLKQRPYLRAEYIDRLIERHRRENSTLSAALMWDLMMLELWMQAHVR